MTRTTGKRDAGRIKALLITTAVAAGFAVANPAAAGVAGIQLAQSETQNDAGAAQETAEADLTETDRATFMERAPSRMIQGERLIGMAVHGDDGATVGTVRDILLSREGQLQGIVISAGGFLGIGEKLVGVAWDAETMRVEADALQTALTQQQIKDAPDFGRATTGEEPAGDEPTGEQ